MTLYMSPLVNNQQGVYIETMRLRLFHSPLHCSNGKHLPVVSVVVRDAGWGGLSGALQKR